MKRRAAWQAAFLWTALTWASAEAYAKSIVVFAPHPDDEVLMASGVAYSARLRGDTVKVVVVTNGDGTGVSTGYLRQGESVSGLATLGLAENDILFLGYGDATLLSLYFSDDPNAIITSPAGQTATYGDRGLGGKDYHSFLYGTPGDYTKSTLASDIRSAILAYLPDDIYVTGSVDDHWDHRATYLFVVQALLDLIRAGMDYGPVVHSALVHAPCEYCDPGYHWPDPYFTPDHPFPKPPYLGTTFLNWLDVERIPVPPIMQLTDHHQNLKYQAVGQYTSQISMWLYAFCKSDEIFWSSDFSKNVAYRANVTASSEDVANGRQGANAVDGVVEVSRSEGFEWASLGEGAGAWITLTWGAPQEVDRIILHDRPQAAAHVLAGTLLFSDGSNIAVGALPDHGAGHQVSFDPKLLSWVRFTIDEATAQGAGLAEIEALHGVGIAPGDQSPIITSGPVSIPSTITDSEISQLSVVATDPDGDPLTFDWAAHEGSLAADGPVAAYFPPAVSEPTVDTVRVTVRDGRGGEAKGTVQVTVNPSNHPPVITSGPSAAPTAITDQQTSQLAVTATDPDGDALTYAWGATGGSVVGSGATAAFTPPRVTVATSFTVTVAVTDGRGGTTSGSVAISVAPANHPPVITQGPSATPAAISDEQTSQLAVTATDPDGDALTYAWSATGGSVVGSGATAAFTPPHVTVATSFTVTVAVTDGRGGTTSGSVAISVAPANHPPVITSGPFATPTAITDQQKSQLRVAASDPDGDKLTYTWSASGGSVSGAGATATFSPPLVTVPTSFTLTVTATDGRGGTAAGAVTVRVTHANRAPAITSGPSANPATILDVQTSQVSVTATDPDGDPVKYTWRASGGKVSSNGSTALFSPPLVSATKTYSITVTATDGKGGSTNKSVSVTVIPSPNLAVGASVSVSSENASTGQLGLKAIDGVVDGTPHDATKEWATLRELAGAWITLSWSSPRTVSRVVLFDRPNLLDQVRGGMLLFSDGTTVTVGMLPNNASPLAITFSARTVTWVKFKVTSAVGQNTGLAELVAN